MNEREFIARVEAANTQELIQILSRPSLEEDRVLRLHLGTERYERLRQLALQTGGKRGVKKGNVVVLHGIMGGELTVYNNKTEQRIWLHFPRLIIGGAGWLRMRDGGVSIYDVRATGILKKWYSELLLGLAQDWNVQAFWFDWRRDLADAADALNDKISEWFGQDTPVHLVGHSMGGLVARTFILRQAERWKRAWDENGKGLKGGRLVMLGTPNHGSFAIPQICTGVEGSVRKLVIADLKHNASELVSIVNSFPGSYQMLPSNLVMKTMEPLYDAKTYGSFNVPQALLDRARRHHEALQPIVDRDRMSYIAGFNRHTYDDIHDMGGLDSIDAYSASMNGDGTVPHRLGFLEQDGKRIPTFFADAEHGSLPNDQSVIEATLQLLETGQCSRLPASIPARARGPAAVAGAEANVQFREQTEELRLKEITEKTRLRTRGPTTEETPVTADEKEAERLILRSFLGDPRDSASSGAGAGTGKATRERKEPSKGEGMPNEQSIATIELGLVKGGIESVTAKSSAGEPVDAIAVGHYLGVKPQAAEQKLDQAITQSLAEAEAAERRRTGKKETTSNPEQILTLFTERGLIRGDLGQPFIVPDPRDPTRVIVLAGMGIPGHFGVPEMTVLAQELCWSLGRLQKRHLATVLIGAGNGNLPIDDALGGWLRGIRRALTTSKEDEGRRLRRITFVEYDARAFLLIDLALRAAKAKPDPALVIDYRGPTDATLKQARKEARANAIEKAQAEFDQGSSKRESDETVPVRITVGLERKTYQFAAITQSAAVPQRDIPLDPRLVNEANDELAAAESDEQAQSGRFLERLLIPEDIRGTIYTPAPIVLILDSTTARVHWEMVARSDSGAPGRTKPANAPFDPDDFLGTSYGLTRQLRTNFAPTPDPPPPPKRTLRVLIVADPAEDAPLPGAQAEAEEVAATFERFNEHYSELTGQNIVVERLFGPADARRTAVLKKLMLENYDVMHFAGHCVYDKDEPSNSGWLFSLKDDERLTANELKRIDRVPKFIFSNACESGITPDRSELRSAELAPSFAEAFFARGVGNFVCTAWPVDDEAARTFARRLYSELLGLDSDKDFARKNFSCMHQAMREARRAIATDFAGSRTWGAYQHYGNPYFRFFGNTTSADVPRAATPKKKPRPVARARKGKPSAASRRRSKAKKH